MLKKIVWSMAVCSTVFISSSYGEDFDLPTTSTRVKDAPTTSTPSVTSNTSSSETSGGGLSSGDGGTINIIGSTLSNKVNNNHAKNKNTQNGIGMDAKNINVKNSKVINNVNNNHATNENSQNGIMFRAR
jgi:hypothetical protein